MAADLLRSLAPERLPARYRILERSADLRQVQLDVLAEQIAGFYDTDLKAMFVISAEDTLSVMNQILYAHEYTHVLQDQTFDLESQDMDALSEGRRRLGRDVVCQFGIAHWGDVNVNVDTVE